MNLADKLYKIQRTVLDLKNIPKEIIEKCGFLDQAGPDTYIEYMILRKEEGVDYRDFVLDNWLLEELPDMEGRTILIYINE